VGHLHLYLADAARRAGDLAEARAVLARADLGPDSAPGGAQRRAVRAVTECAVARAAGDRDAAVTLLVDA
jgi:hypothetical protein